MNSIEKSKNLNSKDKVKVENEFLLDLESIDASLKSLLELVKNVIVYLIHKLDNKIFGVIY